MHCNRPLAKLFTPRKGCACVTSLVSTLQQSSFFENLPFVRQNAGNCILQFLNFSTQKLYSLRVQKNKFSAKKNMPESKVTVKSFVPVSLVGTFFRVLCVLKAACRIWYDALSHFLKLALHGISEEWSLSCSFPCVVRVCEKKRRETSVSFGCLHF